jgi:hypothetical protein
MEIWQSDAACVRALKTFRMMPWPYKVAELSLVLSPIFVTALANQRSEHLFVGYMWRVAVCLCWLAYANYLLAFVRGYFAERNGIPPSPPGKDPKLGEQRNSLITIIVLLVIFGAANLGLWISFPRPRFSMDWSPEVVFLMLFFQQVSTLAHDRFWSVSFEGQ